MIMAIKLGPVKRGVAIGTIKGSLLELFSFSSLGDGKMRLKATKKSKSPPQRARAYSSSESKPKNQVPKKRKNKAIPRAIKPSRITMVRCFLRGKSFTRVKMAGELPIGFVIMKIENANLIIASISDKMNTFFQDLIADIVEKNNKKTIKK